MLLIINSSTILLWVIATHPRAPSRLRLTLAWIQNPCLLFQSRRLRNRLRHDSFLLQTWLSLTTYDLPNSYLSDLTALLLVLHLSHLSFDTLQLINLCLIVKARGITVSWVLVHAKATILREHDTSSLLLGSEGSHQLLFIVLGKQLLEIFGVKVDLGFGWSIGWAAGNWHNCTKVTWRWGKSKIAIINNLLGRGAS